MNVKEIEIPPLPDLRHHQAGTLCKSLGVLFDYKTTLLVGSSQ